MLRLLLVTGLLGGFTTFSAFSVESLVLLQRGRMGCSPSATRWPTWSARWPSPPSAFAWRRRCWDASRIRNPAALATRRAQAGLKNPPVCLRLIASGEIPCDSTNSPPPSRPPSPTRRAWPSRRSNPYVEPAHLLSALLAQPDGPKALLSRAGANVARLQTALDAEIAKLPQVQGGEAVQPGRELTNLLQAAEKEANKRGDQFIASEMFLLAAADAKGSIGTLLKQNGVTRSALEAAIEAVRGGQKVDSAEAEGQREALKKYTLDLTERARAGQARPGDRPRRRDPPRHPGAAAPHQEQPGADRRARRRQDRHRRGPGAAHRRRRGARHARRTSACSSSTWPCCSPAPSSAASSRSG